MFDLNLDNSITFDKDLIKEPNICDRFTEADLGKIGERVWTGYSRDEQSRIVWKRRTQAAMNLSMQVQEAKIFPLITIGSLHFSANAYTDIIQGTDIVRFRTQGEADQQLLKKAERIGRHMSWQVLEQDEAWEEEHDRLFIYMSIVGSGFVKTYFDATKGYTVSDFVTAMNFVVNYWTKSLDGCSRKTHIIPLFRNEIYEGVMNKIYRDVRNESWFNSAPQIPVGDAEEQKRKGQNPPAADELTPFQALEQCVSLDLDKDGYAEPYVITIDGGSRKVLRIVARCQGEGAISRNAAKEIVSIQASEFYTKYGFIPSPDGGFYESGFGTFLGPINEAVNSGINQLIDAATVNNSNGGFLGRGVKIRGGAYTIAPFEWKRVDSTGDDLKKNMVPFPKSEPSQVTLALIQLLINYANRVSGTGDTEVGENPGQNTPASTYQGMSEKGMQVYQMIFKRVWKSMRQEFRKRFAMNALYLRPHQRFGAGKQFIMREDYLGTADQIAPVADPNTPSSVMQIQQAIAVKQDSLQTPGYDIEVVTRNFLRSLKVENIDQVYPGIGKAKTPPNPKLQLEQMKLQPKMAQIQAQVKKMQSEAALIPAKIHLLEAQAAQAVKEAGNVGVAERLKAFELAIDTVKAHGEMLNERIAALQGQGEGEDGEKKGSADGGGMA